ncbi:S41 family peptidase [Stomatohabitans albus]|uniref:S41 family peptidase n=1 Tax=Stomatohabitans albus TaxID=3110766 RepID=UPI00300CE06A
MNNQSLPTAPRRTLSLLLGGALVLTIGLGSGFLAGRQSVAAVDGLSEIEHVIRDQALAVPDNQTINDGALRGAVASLDDQYASWYSADEFARFSSQLDGKFVGIGVFLERTEVGMLITGVIPNSPAETAGLKAGEYIVAVNGTRLRSTMPFEEMVGLITGEEGTEVSLLITTTAGEEKPYTITRAKFDLPLTQTQMLDNGVASIRLHEFSRGAADSLKTAITEAKSQGAKGIVLDLRSNPGGLLEESIGVMELFVAPHSRVVTIESRHDHQDMDTGDAEPPFGDLPFVVLVNEYSASASEIVSAALQDHGRAKIVGHQTFGKGVVQSVVNLQGGTGMKLTTARYLTPNGENINEIGVTPDVAISASPERVLQEAANYLIETKPEAFAN